MPANSRSVSQSLLPLTTMSTLALSAVLQRFARSHRCAHRHSLEFPSIIPRFKSRHFPESDRAHLPQPCAAPHVTLGSSAAVKDRYCHDDQRIVAFRSLPGSACRALRRRRRRRGAIPPITIHGTPAPDKARSSAASASSIRDRSGPRTAGTLLNAGPAAPHLLDRVLACDIARSGPSPHGLERRQRGQGLRHGSCRSRTLGGLQGTLQARRGSLP